MNKDRVTRWVLPVDDSEDGLVITLPPDLLEQMNLVEGDSIDWTEESDGSIIIKRVEGNQ